jgi:phosphoribosylamine--glycine ligase
LDQTLDQQSTEWDPRISLGVVMAAGGYPGKYRKGDPIEGLSDELPEHLKVFHAGTRLDDGGVVTNGGRVLCAVALGDTVTEAQAQAYELVSQINWKDAYYRTDIGYRAVAREKKHS